MQNRRKVLIYPEMRSANLINAEQNRDMQNSFNVYPSRPIPIFWKYIGGAINFGNTPTLRTNRVERTTNRRPDASIAKLINTS